MNCLEFSLIAGSVVVVVVAVFSYPWLLLPILLFVFGCVGAFWENMKFREAHGYDSDEPIYYTQPGLSFLILCSFLALLSIALVVVGAKAWPASFLLILSIILGAIGFRLRHGRLREKT